MQRLRSSGTSLLGSLAVPQLKRKSLNSWAAVQDTYYSTKDTFERHKVVFTIGTSISSVATAWLGIQKIIGSGSCTFSACVATAETTLIIGYGLGWRGGKSYANKRLRKEQMKMLGQIKPKGWELPIPVT